MKTKSIDELSGRELDAAIHEALFDGAPAMWAGVSRPPYSDDDAREWPRVLDAMEDEGWEYEIGTYHGDMYRAVFWLAVRPTNNHVEYTLAEAVCRAALRAKQGEGDDDG